MFSSQISMLDVLIFEFQKKKIWLPGEPSDIVHFVSHVNRASLASSNARTICFSNFEAKNFIALIVATNLTGYRLPVSTTTTPSIMLVGKSLFLKSYYTTKQFVSMLFSSKAR